MKEQPSSTSTERELSFIQYNIITGYYDLNILPRLLRYHSSSSSEDKIQNNHMKFELDYITFRHFMKLGVFSSIDQSNPT